MKLKRSIFFQNVAIRALERNRPVLITAKRPSRRPSAFAGCAPTKAVCCERRAAQSQSQSLRQPGSLGNVEDVPASPPATHRGSVRAALSAFNASSRDFCQTRTSSILFALCHALDFPKVDGRASANCGHRVLTAPHRRPWGTRDAP